MVKRTTNFDWWDKPNWRELRNKEIAKRYAEGVELKVLSEDYGMTPGTIQFIAYSNRAKRPPEMLVAMRKRQTANMLKTRASTADVKKERNRLMVEAYKSGQTAEQVSKSFEVSASWLKKILRDAGVAKDKSVKAETSSKNFSTAREARRAKLAIDWEACVKMYKEGVPRKQISDQLGYSKAWVEKTLKRAGVKSHRPAGGRGPDARHGLTEEQQMELGIRYGCHEPVEVLERDFGVNRTTIQNIIQKWGYKRGSGVGVMERFKQKLNERRMKK